MHGCSRATIDPPIHIIPGRGPSGFHRPDRPCMHQVRSAVSCAASRIMSLGGCGRREGANNIPEVGGTGVRGRYSNTS